VHKFVISVFAVGQFGLVIFILQILSLRDIKDCIIPRYLHVKG